jgi:S-adenosylmethionine:tRNA ribosyltransferase-isomerase
MKSDVLLFERPENLQATAPTESRAMERDDVRLLVTTPDGNTHARFNELPDILAPGDLLVVNESATIPASLPAEGSLGTFVLNLSTDYGDGLWLAEPRWSSSEPGPMPLEEGEEIRLPGLTGRLVSRYPGLERLWFVRLTGDLEGALARHGSPIRYGYVDRDYPLDAYQTVFARVPGSAEMPSAARPFTHRLVEELRNKGVEIESILLHTGVSSMEVDAEELEDQVLYSEPFEVPAVTADAVNRANDEGRPVIAVGTTVVRALESAWNGDEVRPAAGFTRLYIHPERGIHVVDGLLTGFHDPMASHLAMLYALAGEEMVRSAYTEAVKERYLWHEFGDSNLILPRAR